MGTLQAYPGPVNGGLRLLAVRIPAPRYLQQPFLPFAAAFFFAFTSLTSFHWMRSPKSSVFTSAAACGLTGIMGFCVSS